MVHSQTSIDEKKLKKMYEDPENHVVLYEYIPTLFSPFYCSMEPMRFVRRIRLMDEYLKKGHYKVYYLAIDGTIVGYNVLSPGGRRLSFSGPNDIVSGPAFIDPNYRSKGYNRLMKRLCFDNCSYDYDYVYNWVDKSNIPSIKSVEKMGFEKVGEVKVIGLRHKLVPAENGTCIVYRFPSLKRRKAQEG